MLSKVDATEKIGVICDGINLLCHCEADDYCLRARSDAQIAVNRNYVSMELRKGETLFCNGCNRNSLRVDKIRFKNAEWSIQTQYDNNSFVKFNYPPTNITRLVRMFLQTPLI